MELTGNCVLCKKPFVMGVNVYSAAGVRETKITGFCETCFDKITLPEDEPQESDDE